MLAETDPCLELFDSWNGDALPKSLAVPARGRKLLTAGLFTFLSSWPRASTANNPQAAEKSGLGHVKGLQDTLYNLDTRFIEASLLVFCEIEPQSTWTAPRKDYFQEGVIVDEYLKHSVKMVGLDAVSKIKKLVFDSVFKRALDIAGSDLLLGISFEGDDLETCNAECIGSSSTDIYNLNVNIIGDKAVGKCSCPASANAKDGLCKHIIALLLRRNDKLQEKSATFLRDRKQEAEIDEYPVQNIGSEEEDVMASPSSMTELTPHENGSNPITSRPDLKQSSSKRVLPTWMLGVVGSAENEESPKASKRKRKPLAEKPPRAPPPPTKRARRRGQPLKVSNDLDEEEGPGEIDVAEPALELFEDEVEEPVVEDDENFDDPACSERTGHLRKPMHPRSRSEMQLVKQRAGEIESNKGDENIGARVGRSQAQRRSKSRRVVGKLVEVDSDLSEDERRPSFARDERGALEDVTDDDLMLLAQEHVANENGSLGQDAPVGNQSIIASEGKEVFEKQTFVKSTSKFSLNNWKEISSRNDRAPLSIADSLDLETLKTYSQQADSQSKGQCMEELYIQGADVGVGAFPSSQSRYAAEGESMTAPDADKDSIASDMLGLIFGSSLGANVVRCPIPLKEISSDIGGENSNGAYTFRALESSSSENLLPISAAPVLPAGAKGPTENLSVESKPKKKGSLKDKIKMLLD